MRTTRLALTALVLAFAADAAAESLVVPVFAHNVSGRDQRRWSSELYLTNPTTQPVQVTLSHLLPGHAVQPAPCDFFMPPTRVVPPHSAVVWTAAGLAVDLGCAEEALGALILFADGDVDVSSRLVSHREAADQVSCAGFLSGQGQDIPAIALDRLPAAGSYLLPTLLWDRSPGGADAFDIRVGFANPNPRPVMVAIDLPSDLGPARIRLDDLEVELPLVIEIGGESWRQLSIDPVFQRVDADSSGPMSFDLWVETYAPIALYASVLDRSSGDPRTVLPVRLH